MFYNCENPIISVISVEHMTWKEGAFDIKPRSYSALAFRIKGDAIIKAGGKNCYIGSNDVLYLPQGIPYHAQYTDTEMIVIHFLTSKDDTTPQVYVVSNPEQIYKAFINSHTMWQNKKPGYTAYVLSQLYWILGQISENEARTNLPERFLRAVSYINSNFKSNDLSADVICQAAGISATSLRILFKQHYKKTPTEYITGLRLEYARSLISCGAPIEEAAERSGFSDAKYFARVVKKSFGCTPRELRYYGK